MRRTSKTPDPKERANHAAFALAQLGSLINVPDGHAFVFNRKHELTWFRGGPSTSLSATVQRRPPASADPSQIHAEARVFLDRPRATLWLEEGPRLVGEARSMFATDAIHLHADTYEALVRNIASRFNEALHARRTA